MITTRNANSIDNKLGLIQLIQHQKRLNTIPQKKKKKTEVIEIPQVLFKPRNIVNDLSRYNL
jgi:hypothetical protein